MIVAIGIMAFIIITIVLYVPTVGITVFTSVIICTLTIIDSHDCVANAPNARTITP